MGLAFNRLGIISGFIVQLDMGVELQNSIETEIGVFHTALQKNRSS